MGSPYLIKAGPSESAPGLKCSPIYANAHMQLLLVRVDPIRSRNIMENCLTEISAVWAYNSFIGYSICPTDPSTTPKKSSS